MALYWANWRPNPWLIVDIVIYDLCNLNATIGCFGDPRFSTQTGGYTYVFDRGFGYRFSNLCCSGGCRALKRKILSNIRRNLL